MWVPTCHRSCGPQAWPGAPRWLCLSSPRIGNRRNMVYENSQETGPGFSPSVQGLVYKFISCAKPTFKKRSLFAGASGQGSSCLENGEGCKINISCPGGPRPEFLEVQGKESIGVGSSAMRHLSIFNTYCGSGLTGKLSFITLYHFMSDLSLCLLVE